MTNGKRGVAASRVEREMLQQAEWKQRKGSVTNGKRGVAASRVEREVLQQAEWEGDKRGEAARQVGRNQMRYCNKISGKKMIEVIQYDKWEGDKKGDAARKVKGGGKEGEEGAPRQGIVIRPYLPLRCTFRMG